ncbi:MAG TPA: hypothetical protein DDZ89_17735, partial [Clostridiales bacterium]|nr:hypothetical protein [Clostridiales bacterium]
TLHHEQEYRLLLSCEDDDFKDTLAVLHLYCLEDDLHHKRPFKGDLHLHSYYSDGRNSPGFIAASCRKAGLDFMAITDHRAHDPSIEAQQDFSDMDIDLKIFRGEEIHPPKTHTHMVGFGNKESVRKHFTDEDAYIETISEKSRNVDFLETDQEKYEYASCSFVIDQVRQEGGICIFAHPYWATGNRYNVSSPLTEAFLKTGIFDAFELFNGDTLDINAIQLALYHDLFKQYKIPLVSGTDSHGVIRHPFFGTFFTVVYSEDCQLDSLTANIQELNSVVVMPVKDSSPFVFGPLRLVKYTLYLLREIIPLHDELCKEEGILMDSALRGSKNAKAALSVLKGQTTEYYKKMYEED